MMKTKLAGIGMTLGFMAALGMGCSSDSAAGGSDPGSGSGTLQVSAHIEATERIDNASTPNDFDTDFEVTVFRAGAAVDDAVVTITPKGGSAITLTAVGGGSGRYTGSQSHYAETYTLTVEAGADYLRGARLEGPDIHTFTVPTVGQVAPAMTDLTITWQRQEAADEARIETDEYDEATIADSGEHTVPGMYFEGDNDQQVEDRVSLRRTNRLNPAGTTSGSEFRISVRNRVEFMIDVAP